MYYILVNEHTEDFYDLYKEHWKIPVEVYEGPFRTMLDVEDFIKFSVEAKDVIKVIELG